MISEIGPSYANQIIELRQEEVFWSLDDLSRVSGISAGGSRLTKIKEQGLACAGPLDYIWVEEDEQEEENEQEQEEQEESENENDEDQDEEDQEESEEELVFLAPGTPQTQTLTINTTPSWAWEDAKSSAGEIEEYLVEWSQDSEFVEGVFSNIAQEPLFVHETALEEGTWYLRVKAKDIEDNFSLFSDSGMVTVEAPSHAVVINEIAWMGTKASPQHEWIELYNNTDEDIDLEGWQLSWGDGVIVSLSSVIPAQEYYVLARTSKDNLLEVFAHMEYSGNLQNSGTVMELRSSSGNLVDVVGCARDEAEECAEWFAGNNTTKQTMERINPLELGSNPANWASNTLFVRNGLDKDGEPVSGTPGEKNSVSYEETTISTGHLAQLYGEFNEITIPTYGGTYVAQGSLTIPQEKTLKIVPGVTLAFNAGKQLLVRGTLLAQGTEDLPILFTRAESSAWNGIRFFETSSNDSEISHAVIEGGLYQPDFSQLGAERRFNIGIEGSSPTIRNVSFTSGSTWRGAIFLYNSNSLIESVEIRGANYSSSSTAGIFVIEGSPTIKNSTFYNNTIGIYVHGPLASSTITENTFEKGLYPVYLNRSYATVLGNEVLDHTYHAIAVTGSVQDLAVVWESNNLPFLVISNFSIATGATLSVAPGSTVLFANPNPHPILLGVYGTLKAEGTEENPILLSDYSSWAGGSAKSWRYIQFHPSSTGSVIAHAVIQNGGAIITGNTSYGLLYVQESELELLNVTLKNGKRYEMVIENVLENAVLGSNVLIVHNQENSYEAIKVIGQTCPAFTNLEIQGGSVFAQNSLCQ